MYNSLKKICDLFHSSFNNSNINQSHSIKIRQSKNGITPLNVLLYRLLYTHQNNTQDHCSALIKDNLNLGFSRQAFEKKDKNIPISIYQQLYSNIRSFTDPLTSDPLIAVDGCNNNIDFKVNLNLGFFNISNGIPIGVNYLGSDNRNGEVRAFKELIQSDPDLFKNAIFVCDRLYFDYNLIDYLNNNNYRYIIRVKGKGINIDPSNSPKKSYPKTAVIKRIKNFGIRLVKYVFTDYQKIELKKNKKKYIQTIKKVNDYKYVTNLPANDFDDQTIIDAYKSRWDIEIFFKLIKRNFKFQTFIDTDKHIIQKSYICQLIITHIIEIIIKAIKKEDNNSTIKKRNGKKVNCTLKINRTHLITRLYDKFIYKMFTGFTKDELDDFIKGSIKTMKNEKDRMFPRIAKTPFKKWYLKGQSIRSQLKRICYAILEGTDNKLNKNLQIISKKIKMVK